MLGLETGKIIPSHSVSSTKNRAGAAASRAKRGDVLSSAFSIGAVCGGWT